MQLVIKQQQRAEIEAVERMKDWAESGDESRMYRGKEEKAKHCVSKERQSVVKSTGWRISESHARS